MAVEGQATPTGGETTTEFALPKQRTVSQNIWKFIRGKPLGAFGVFLVFFLVAMTLGTPQLTDWDVPNLPDRPLGFQLGEPWMSRYGLEDKFYTAEDRLAQQESPSADHWLGTDKNGRDTWSRIVHGARRSLFVALWALIFATVVGTTIGVISGYFRGSLDTGSQRFMDALQAFPPLIAIILIVTINPLSGDQPNLIVIAVALGIVGVPTVQRITRSVVLSTREQPYVDAARVIGATDARTMWYYILPNIFASTIIVFSTGLGVAILAEAALSFIVPDKVPQGASWGLMLSEAQSFLVEKPWMGIASAGAIALAVLGFNLAGDALRDVLDPRLRI
jgi:ABC-type dipeptide/oligopeptide/nickel transport system permease subunit